LHVGAGLEIEDLGSSNGTKVQDVAIAPNRRVPLEPGDVISIGTSVLIVQVSAGSARPRRLWQHGYFEVRLEDECARARRRASTFAIVRVQVDQTANAAAVLEILASALRMSDVLARYGPDDYEALLVDAEPEETDQVVQRVVSRLAAAAINARCGAARYPVDGRTPEALMSAVTSQVIAPAPAETASVVVEDPLMRRLYEMVRRVAASNINVLVLGETGVGKEVIAAAIHSHSARAGKPYLRLNCAALSESLLESELFGHEKGAFTGADKAKPGLLETAEGGTVLLDEIGEMPLAIQAKLLRVIDAREVMRVGGLKTLPIDVRFVAATNRDLEAEAARGTFRQDLYFRLGGFTLVVPPLRQRVSEIESLAIVFAADACRAANRKAVHVTPAALELLRRYSWPGNVRELRNVIERAVVLCSDDAITPEHLPVEKMGETVAVHAPRELPARKLAAEVPDDPSLTADERAERDRIIDAMARAGGNQSRACQLLGISRGTLIQRIARYQIPRPRKGQTT
jgi:transcriptional regulator with GAF, ATPase, and Fis domain